MTEKDFSLVQTCKCGEYILRFKDNGYGGGPKGKMMVEYKLLFVLGANKRDGGSFTYTFRGTMDTGGRRNDHAPGFCIL